MGASIVGAQKGGGRCVDVGNILHHCVSSGSPLWVGVVGNVPADWEGDGQISPSGDMAADGAYATLKRGRYMEIPSPGRGDGRGGTAGDINLHKPSKKTVTQYIATRPIMDLCLATECRPGERVLTL